ncbi:hypothetical protein COCOBI_10-2840 [Coccomyxa sp. Obi]|nr:hypothetical protein COCOBI_10-2840 [Coccomyxa sp. Obi]
MVTAATKFDALAPPKAVEAAALAAAADPAEAPAVAAAADSARGMWTAGLFIAPPREEAAVAAAPAATSQDCNTAAGRVAASPVPTADDLANCKVGALLLRSTLTPGGRRALISSDTLSFVFAASLGTKLGTSSSAAAFDFYFFAAFLTKSSLRFKEFDAPALPTRAHPSRDCSTPALFPTELSLKVLRKLNVKRFQAGLLSDRV